MHNESSTKESLQYKELTCSFDQIMKIYILVKCGFARIFSISKALNIKALAN